MLIQLTTYKLEHRYTFPLKTQSTVQLETVAAGFTSEQRGMNNIRYTKNDPFDIYL